MNKSLCAILALLVSAGMLLPQFSTADDVKSLRGDIALDKDAKLPAPNSAQEDGAPLTRNYAQQPPLIPHDISGFQINLKQNECLGCHDRANYKDSGATEISKTHFEDRDNHVLADVSARRYFCTQCHVPQDNIKPLVENTFKPIQAVPDK